MSTLSNLIRSPNIQPPTRGVLARVVTTLRHHVFFVVAALGASGGATAAPAPHPKPEAAAPTIAKTFNPTSIVLGDVSTLTTASSSNSQVNPAQLTADFVDTFPANLIVANSLPGTNCTNGAASATPGGGSVTLTDNGGGSPAEIPARGSCTLTVQAQAASAAPTGFIHQHNQCGGSENDSRQQHRAGDSHVECHVFRSDCGQAIQSDQHHSRRFSSTLDDHVAEYRSRERNISRRTWSDTFPANMQAANPANQNTTCTGGVATATPGGTTLTLANGAQIPSQGSCTVSDASNADRSGHVYQHRERQRFA